MTMADIEAAIDEMLATDPGSLDPAELLAATVNFEPLRSKLEAAAMAHLAAVESADILRNRVVRNTQRWLTHETRIPTGLAGKRVRLSNTAIHRYPAVWHALAAGSITIHHAEALLGLSEQPELRAALDADLPTLLGWAQREPWPKFKGFLAGWQALVDERDPQDIDDEHHAKRRLTFSQNQDGMIDAELHTTGFCWSQIEAALQPLFDTLFTQDWDAARAEFGEQATSSHLARTDQQRWHDALIRLARAGAAATDPGTSVEVIIVVDDDTLIDEADRQTARETGQTVPPPRPPTDAETYRCQTLSGIRLTPSTALLAAVAGSIRRVTLNTRSLDFEASARTRLFTGALRTALIVRDRYCTEPGCHTPAHRCQADHRHRYTDGGKTVPANGVMLCPPAHRHKSRLETMGLWPREGP